MERANVRTWEQAHEGGHWCTACARIRLFVSHSLTAGMAQARGTWNVGTWNVQTCERGSRRTRVGIPVRGARPHSFIRFPFVDSGHGTGTWNVERGTWERGTCKRANGERGTGNVGTWERGNVERGHLDGAGECVCAFSERGTWERGNVERGNLRTGNVQTCKRANVQTCECSTR